MKTFKLPIAILLTGLLFIFVIPQENDYIRLVFKLLPMVLILFYAYQKQNPYHTIMHERLLLAGLFVCMLGDAFIIFSFLFGLVAFLIGHIFYIPAFIKQWNYSLKRSLTIIPLVLYSCLLGYKITSALIAADNTLFIIPVIIYIIVISIMGWSAIMSGNKWAIIGSLFFIISDSILSWNMFVSSINHSSVWIMLTYYVAQFLIAHSLSQSSNNQYIYRNR